MNLLPLILAKRAGYELDETQIHTFVNAVSTGATPDYQISAFLMAVFFKGMTRNERVALTRAMAESGETLDWSALSAPTADKHSTGGVGDKISLILAPLAVALGMAVPMLSGRGLGFTGGTLDKLESIPGFSTDLDRAAFAKQMAEIGCGLIGQSGSIAPADRKLYSLRDVTGTVESLPLIVSSILSKKIAAGPASLVIDLKVGRGAFMRDLASAQALGTALRETAHDFGRRCTVLFTAMDAPLGLTVGNRPEVVESLEVLAGNGPEDIRDLTLALTSEMALLAGLSATAHEAWSRATAALDDGSALRIFGDIVLAQGGRLDLQAKGWGMPAAAHRAVLTAPVAGHLVDPDARKVGRIAVDLGAGRQRAEDEVDGSAGIIFARPWGASLARGEEIAFIEGADPARVDRAAEALGDVLEVAADPPTPASLFLGILDDAGYHSWQRPDISRRS
ncbi:MAG: thymidine phosphorylase [bacterium]|nr:thymidine phosphorylase [bacterium]